MDDIASLVAMLVQTDKFGTSVAQSLRVHSETVRTKRRQRAEEALRTAHEALEVRVQERTTELATALAQLQAEMHERQQLAQLLLSIAAHTTIVMAEHDVPLVRAVATRVSAFSNGRTLVEGDADTVFESPDVQRVFLRGVRDA